MIVKSEIQVRLTDIDIAGHVYNGIYLAYFEEARVAWFDAVVGKDWDWAKYGVVLARNEINYLTPIYYRDHVFGECYLIKLGSKSFELAYRLYKIVKGKNIECANGKSVMVCFNYSSQKAIPMPVEWHTKFNDLLSVVK